MQLEELIGDQGELALIVEEDNGQYKFTSYCLPKNNSSFDIEEVQNVYLAKSMDNPVFEDKDCAVLSQYLDTVGLPVKIDKKTMS